jgi:pyridoxamine 5'-phosphate oxidase
MTEKEKLQNLRSLYSKKSLSETNVNPDPVKQFSKWFREALKTGFIHPNAMTLATAAKKCKPSARIVLLKGFDEKGFVFFTNYKSRKGSELAGNPYASLLFFWDKLERQVRIEGKIQMISREETKEYFDTRPYKSRIGAWASNQSSVIKNRALLTKNFLKYLDKFKETVPVPPDWGGYRVVPDSFEFWQGRPNRLHDRIRYTKYKSRWKIERLAP